MITTVGKVLLKFYTPPQFHQLIDEHLMDKKGISKLCEEIAEKTPAQYSKVMADLSRLGFEVATRQGTSITLQDLVSPVDTGKAWDEFEKFRTTVEKTTDSRAVKDHKIFDKYSSMMKTVEQQLLADGLAKDKSLAKIIMAGARGSVAQYRNTIATQGIVVDGAGKPKLDLPIKSSYAEGLSLPEYLATSFGARTGEVLKKISVAQGGYGCLTENCLVVLPDWSTKSIRDVQVGDVILGSAKDGTILPVTVTAKFDSGPKEVFNHVFQSLAAPNMTKSFEGTLDHGVAVYNGSKRLQLNGVKPTKRPVGKIQLGGFWRLTVPKLPMASPTRLLAGDAAKQLRTNMYLEASRYSPYQLVERQHIGIRQTWDIEVDHPDHLFLLSSGIIVSNSKQFARALMPLQIVEADCGTQNGIAFPVKDRETIGAYLAKPVKGYNRNQEVTGKMLTDLEKQKVDKIVVRSPMTCQSNKTHHSGGLCQMCVGQREKGTAPIDSYIGLVAGTALAEPLTESAMKARHSGGAATTISGNQGFKLINQLANIPKTFLGRAPLAQADGVVTDITPAAAGGFFIKLNGDEEHYIGPEQEPKVKKGQRVEQGEVLSSGLIDPREAVRLRGIGDGRKYYMEAMKKAFDDAGLYVNRRNFELVSKAAVDHVKVTDPEGLGGHLPDAVVSYSTIEHDYEARKDSKQLRVDQAYGYYLERPELHYTIGTKITSAVQRELLEHHITSILVNKQPPQFEPHMVRLLDVPEIHDDWMHVLNTTNLSKRFVNMVNKGATSDTKGSSPIAGLAYGVGFGQKDEKRP